MARILKKRTATFLYMNINAIITVGALHFFKKNFYFDDKAFYIKTLAYSVFVFLFLGIVHYFFMKLIFDKYNK
jgi:uncharacterized membrane protein YhfC